MEHKICRSDTIDSTKLAAPRLCSCLVPFTCLVVKQLSTLLWYISYSTVSYYHHHTHSFPSVIINTYSLFSICHHQYILTLFHLSSSYSLFLICHHHTHSFPSVINYCEIFRNVLSVHFAQYGMICKSLTSRVQLPHVVLLFQQGVIFIL